jgi:uncharacterized protein YbjT (DUF2867 family)
MPSDRDRIIFVAGASGVIGRSLCRLLVGDGWTVIGTTRSRENPAALHAIGVEPVVVDVFDNESLVVSVREARPRVVIHQLTDLPDTLAPERMAEALVRNARIRAEGTRNRSPLQSRAVPSGWLRRASPSHTRPAGCPVARIHRSMSTTPLSA